MLEAGAYVLIRFNHKILRLFWLAAYIAWEGYRVIHNWTLDPSDLNLARFNSMLDRFYEILESHDASLEKMPPDIPEPGQYPTRDQPEILLPAELATVCAGWAMLHEMKHLKDQQDGGAASADAAPSVFHSEELSCDEFATNFILARSEEFARGEKVSPLSVRTKRELGILFAVFAITLIAKDRWAASERHPAVQTRIDAILNSMNEAEGSVPVAIAYAAYVAFWKTMPNAPGVMIANGND